MPKAAGPSEADLVFNRVSLQLAQLSQKLLGPRGDGGPTTYEALEDESEDVFTADAELPGLGAAPLGESNPNGSIKDGRPLFADHKFRKQMLGKHARQNVLELKKMRSLKGMANGTGHSVAKAKPTSIQTLDDSDDEGGRSALVGSKRRKVQEASRQHKSAQDSEEEEVSQREQRGLVEQRRDDTASEVAGKKPGSYLEEVLAKRSKRQKKKKKKDQLPRSNVT